MDKFTVGKYVVLTYGINDSERIFGKIVDITIPTGAVQVITYDFRLETVDKEQFGQSMHGWIPSEKCAKVLDTFENMYRELGADIFN